MYRWYRNYTKSLQTSHLDLDKFPSRHVSCSALNKQKFVGNSQVHEYPFKVENLAQFNESSRKKNEKFFQRFQFASQLYITCKSRKGKPLKGRINEHTVNTETNLFRFYEAFCINKKLRISKYKSWHFWLQYVL